MQSSDHASVLGLNRASVAQLSPLDEQRLAWIVSLAHRCLVAERAGAVVGFAVTIAPQTGYDSANYRWFGDRFERFLYLDRVVVAEGDRRRGVATRLYEQLEPLGQGCGRVVCDINVEPPNLASLAFHERRGYQQIGRLEHSGHAAGLFCKELGPRPPGSDAARGVP